MRLWDDMPTDPKWRVIARRSGRSISEVIAVFNILLIQGGENDEKRGVTRGNDDDEIAAALDIEAEHIAAIRDAMQGKVLDGNKLSGWDIRQPKREDNSLERVRKHRAKEDAKRNVTHGNGEKRPEAEAEAEELLPNGNKRVAPKLAEKPDDVPDQVWKDFKRARDKLKAPLTITALAGIEREAKKAGWMLADALAECCERGWRGFKAEWVTKGNGNGRRSSTTRNGFFDAIADEERNSRA